MGLETEWRFWMLNLFKSQFKASKKCFTFYCWSQPKSSYFFHWFCI